MLHDFGCAVDRRGHDRPRHGGGLDRGERHPFVEGGQREHVDGVEHARDVGAEAGEDHRRRDAERLDLGLERLAPAAVADQEQTRVGEVAGHGGPGVEEIAMALLILEPADDADDRRVRIDTQILPRRLSIAAGHERREVAAVRHDDHLVGRIALHAHEEVASGLGDGDDASHEAREEAVGHEGSPDRPVAPAFPSVIRLHHRGHAMPPGERRRDDHRPEEVRVHDVGTHTVDETRELADLGPAPPALRRHRLDVDGHTVEVAPERLEERARRRQGQPELRGRQALEERQHDFLDAPSRGRRQHEHQADRLHAATSRADRCSATPPVDFGIGFGMRPRSSRITS